MLRAILVVTVLAVALDRTSATAQQLATDDPVLRAIWNEAANNSSLEPMAQSLLDSIGPRLTGSPGMERAQDWAVRMLRSWGVEARLEQYGTWEGWDRGPSHVDLMEPRVRSLEGGLLAWSPGTGGGPVEAAVTYLPALSTSGDWRAFLDTVERKWVMIDFPQPTCRPNEQWLEHGVRESVLRMDEARRGSSQVWLQSLQVAREAEGGTRELHAAIERAGGAGIVTSDWRGGGIGSVRIFDADNRATPTFQLSCEDYGLVYRLAANGQDPVVRLSADADNLGEVPVYNVIGEIRGTELPEQYVLLSAHYDSWEGSSGATDNGSGSLVMLEAMRVLRAAYPNPRRTILIGLWNGEEQGLNGSGAFAQDHPEVVAGLQAMWNLDFGTGRVDVISAHGFVDAGGSIARWLGQVPAEVGATVDLQLPGSPPSGGSDYSSFVCHGAPAFALGTVSWDYTSHTWHSNRDTYDKLVFDDLRNNAILTASLAYLASEDEEFTSRRRRTVLPDRNGQPGAWPECRSVQRSSPTSNR